MVETNDTVGPHVHTPHFTDGEVLHWVEQHVTEIRMNVVGPNEGELFTVNWIDNEGNFREGERCTSLRDLAERHRDE